MANKPQEKPPSSEQRPPDIYATPRSDPEARAFLGHGAPADTMFWTAEWRRTRRASRLFGLGVVLFVLLICVIVFQQYLITIQPRRGRAVASPRATAETPRPLPAADFSAPLEAVLFAEELASVSLLPIPEEGNLPFDAQWIKQAAYYVMMGEKAYKAEQLEAAAEHFRKALKIFPSLRGVHRYLGLIALQLKDYPAAAEHFQRAAEEDASSFGVANNLGVTYLGMKDYDTAEQYFLQALKLKPDYAPAYLNLATLHMRAGRKAKAADYFARYLALEPGDMRAAQTYAAVLMELERWPQAVALLEGVCQSAPDVAPLHFLLAQALAHTANRETAIEALKRGASLVDPRKALAWMSRPEFDGLRDHPEFQALIASLSASPE